MASGSTIFLSTDITQIYKFTNYYPEFIFEIFSYIANYFSFLLAPVLFLYRHEFYNNINM